VQHEHHCREAHGIDRAVRVSRPVFDDLLASHASDLSSGTKKDLMALPDEVIDTFGYALHLAQTGKKHGQAKPLHGFGSAGVLGISTACHIIPI